MGAFRRQEASLQEPAVEPPALQCSCFDTISLPPPPNMPYNPKILFLWGQEIWRT